MKICCDTCIKNDVCKIRDDTLRAINEAEKVQDRTNTFITIEVTCNKSAPMQPINRGIQNPYPNIIPCTDQSRPRNIHDDIFYDKDGNCGKANA
jgi:hypothetical protein